MRGALGNFLLPIPILSLAVLAVPAAVLAGEARPALQVPDELTPQAMEDLQLQMGKLGRRPDWDAIEADLDARSDTPAVRYTRAVVQMARQAVWAGERAEAVLQEMREQAEARADRGSKVLAAHLLLAIGKGRLRRGHNADGIETISQAVTRLRSLGDDRGLVRALISMASGLIHSSRQPADALPYINELLLVARRAGMEKYEQEANRLYDEWRREQDLVDDFFGRASSRVKTFAPSLGVPVDADLVAVMDGVLLMNGDTDDQMPRAKPEFVRFDGIFVRKLELHSDTLELRGSTVDDKGVLWAATNRGLFLYDGKSITHLVNPDLADEQENELARELAKPDDDVSRKKVPLRSNVVNEVKQGPDGRMYMATNDGLAVFDPRADAWEFFTEKDIPIPKVIERVAPAPDGTLVVAWQHDYAVRRADGTWKRLEFKFPTLTGFEHGHLFGLLIDREGHPWVHGLVGGQRLAGDRVVRIVDRRFNLMTRSVNHVLRAADGAWWFATPDGICRQQGRSCATLNAKRWLPAEWALDLLEWPVSNVWVSVYQGGLYRLTPPHYRQFGIPDGFTQPMNSDVMEFGGMLFFGQPDGLTRLDPSTGRIDNFMNGNEGMPRGVFATDLVLRLSTDRIAYAGRGFSDGKEIGLFDGRQSEVIDRSMGLPDEEIQAMCERKSGVILLAYASGLHELDTDARKVRPAEGFAELAGRNVSLIVCAPDRPVWVLTHDEQMYMAERGGVRRIDPAHVGLAGVPKSMIMTERAGLFVIGERNVVRYHQGSWQPLEMDPEEFDFKVRDVVTDDRGWLYFSTESGVFVHDGENWTRLTVADGLISDTAFDMLWYEDRLWITGQGGVVAWSWPEQEPPETWLIDREQALFSDAAGRPCALRISDGVEKKGWVLLKGTAGIFEVPERQAGPFLPSGKGPVEARAVGLAGGPSSPVVFDTGDVSFSVTAAVPYMDDPPGSFFYHYRLNGGAWTKIERQTFELTGLADGEHELEVRATDRRLVRDPTPVEYRFVVDTPIPPWQIAGAGLALALLIFLGRRRIARAWHLWSHRRFRPIDPSPFRPDRPAEGDSFVDREDEIASLQALIGSGGVAVVWGQRGVGKHSLMRRLARRLHERKDLVVELDLAEAVAGGDVAGLARALVDRLSDLAEQAGVQLVPPEEDRTGTSRENSSSGSAYEVSVSIRTPSSRGSSTSGERNPFSVLSRHLQKFELARPDVRVALLLDNAEVLGVAMETDAAYGSYLFPFLRSLVQQRSNLAVVLALEGQWSELSRRFEQLLAFATPFSLSWFDHDTSAALLTGALRNKAWLPDEAIERLVDLTGGHPYLLQFVGDRLVAALNAAETNICKPALVEGVADEAVGDPYGRLKATWLGFKRDEKLVTTALGEQDDAATLEQIVARLGEAGGKLLFEEARRAVLSLVDDGVVEVAGEHHRLRCGLFRIWVQRHHTISSVLEESLDTVAHYQLIEKLGAGGMGVVYKARDMVQGGTLAVKLLRPELSENKRSRLRFLREARLGKKLKHTSIIRILDYGEQGGRLYLAMELLDGVSLARWARRHRPVDLGRVAEIGRHLASALGAIHELGVLHRDVKSDNVMVIGGSLEPGQEMLPGAIKLMDFGLALGEDVSRMTRAGSLLGTLTYMSPEQARGEDVDARSDLYSLGVVLYELCAGRPPFVGNETAVLNALLNEQVPDLRQLRPDTPEKMARLIEELLRKGSADRPGSAAVVEKRLLALLDELPVAALDLPAAAIGVGAEPASDRTTVPVGETAASQESWRSGHSEIRSRTLEVMKLESVLLTSLSSAGGDESAASLADQALERTRRLIYRVSAAVARGELDGDKLADCLRQVVEAMRASRGLVALIGNDGDGLVCAAAHGHDLAAMEHFPTFAGLMGKCVEQQIGLVYSGEFQEQGTEIGTAVCAPLWAGEEIHGAMLIDRKGGQALAFDDPDLELLVCIGYLLGLGLERERLYRQALDKERLAVVGKMLAGVAHDIRSPMAVISGYTEMMASMREEQERQECVDIIHGQVDEMNDMISNLMAYVRGDGNLQISRIELARLGDEVRDTLALQCAPKGIDLIVDADGGRVRLDVARTKRIIYNLGRNALEAMKKGGRLLMQLREDDGGLVLIIRDNGPGIPEDLRQRMFEPFVTAGKKTGTGLGLSIVKRFVEDQHGELSVQTTPDKGTTFTIRIPRA